MATAFASSNGSSPSSSKKSQPPPSSRTRKKGVVHISSPLLLNGGEFESVSSLVESFLDIHPDFLGQYILSKIDPLTLEKWILLFEERNRIKKKRRKSNPVSAIKKTARSLSSEGSAPSTFSKFRKYSHDLFKSLGREAPSPLAFFQQPHNDSLEGISQNLFISFEASDLRLFLFDIGAKRGFKLGYNVQEGFIKEPCVDASFLEDRGGRDRPVVQDEKTGRLIGKMRSNSMVSLIELTRMKESFTILDEYKLSQIQNVLKVLLGLLLQNEIREEEEPSLYENPLSSIVSERIPSPETFKLSDFDFNYLHLKELDQFRSVVSMMEGLNLIQRFQIDKGDLLRWISSVYKNYRNAEVPFHNWYHGFNVAQTMFVMLDRTGWKNEFLTDVERLSLFISCLCHDLDHPGTNNSFQKKTQSHLSALYDNSILENYHVDRTLYLLNHPNNNILKNLSDDEYIEATHLITQRILDTDLALYFKEAPRIKKASFSAKEHLPEHKSLVMSALMTAADLNMASKPWEVYNQVSGLLAEEFWAQGDMEKDLGLVPEPLMDRELSHLFPNMQVDFLDKVCIPVMEIVSRFHCGLKPLADKALENKEKWLVLAAGGDTNDQVDS